MTIQEDAWKAGIGREYTDRNTLSYVELDMLYWDCFRTTRSALNARFLEDVPLSASILEVGCNIGMQLRHLQKGGYVDLHGIELQQYAIDRLCVKDVDVRQGSAESLPYEDGSFDLVFTSGVLIHLPIHILGTAIREMMRVSRHWIWGFEYYSYPRQEITDRNWQDMLWSDDYPALFDARLIRRWSEAYRAHLPGTVADMYLLERR